MDQGGDGGEGDGANFVEAGGHKLRKAKASASKDDVPVRGNSRAIPAQLLCNSAQFGAILTPAPHPSGAQTLAPVLEPDAAERVAARVARERRPWLGRRPGSLRLGGVRRGDDGVGAVAAAATLRPRRSLVLQVTGRHSPTAATTTTTSTTSTTSATTTSSSSSSFASPPPPLARASAPPRHALEPAVGPRPASTFLDIGSGYGKVNLHIRLLTGAAAAPPATSATRNFGAIIAQGGSQFGAIL